MRIQERRSFVPLVLFSLFSFSLLSPAIAVKKSYVVHLGEVPSIGTDAVTSSQYELLESFLGSMDKAQDAIIYSYTSFINGFAAMLEEEEAMEISKHPGVVSVLPNRARELHTTRTWEFMGLERNGEVLSESIWSKARFGEDTIIGNLDTGVWPESESFNDEGMGPIPSRWKGICQNDSPNKFNCNRPIETKRGDPSKLLASKDHLKLIGARYFNKGYIAAGGSLNATSNSPRDTEGHGSHTLSTAAGSPVAGANIFGQGNGTARGGSPGARVAAYKVCWPQMPNVTGGCYDADILAGFEAAIADGVDVISFSVGGPPSEYYLDTIAIGSFYAVKKGITVVASAGNSGPAAATVTNLAPWIFTVAASTFDREFTAHATFGKKRVKGGSVSSAKLPPKKFYPMIDSAKANSANASNRDSKFCLLGSLSPSKVKGKIVVCLRGEGSRLEKGEAVRWAGGVGMILANNESNSNLVEEDLFIIPAIDITYSDSLALYSYLNSTTSPHGRISAPMTEFTTRPAPVTADFSSKGPNSINPEILKPDITAPGVKVLAAYSRAAPPTSSDLEDERRVDFNLISGTSMSCPHVSGVVGLLKTMYPKWSPSAMRSAIMTTARTRDNMKEPMKNSSMKKATPFDYGAGHMRPNRAMNPGLVYDLNTNDYLNFLCAIGYNSSQISTFSARPYSCPSKPAKVEDLNYPSISVPNLSRKKKTTVVRTLKNVGTPGVYKVQVRSPVGVSVKVRPRKLEFEEVGEEKKFKVVLKAKEGSVGEKYAFGGIKWSDGEHFVRSPIVVKIIKGR